MPKPQYKINEILEEPDIARRYNCLLETGKQFFADSDVSKTEIVTQNDVHLARSFVKNVITQIQPVVWSSYFEHQLIAPLLARLIAKACKYDGALPEFLVWLHDIARLVMPEQYLRNDYVTDTLLTAWGIPQIIKNELPAIVRILEVAEELGLDNDQLNHIKPLNDNQQKMINTYFTSLTPMQRFINIADNLGKRDNNGVLFTLPILFDYIFSQEERYEQNSRWPTINWAIERRTAAAFLQYKIIEKSCEWLKNDFNVDIEKIIESMVDYGPKFIILSRHGEVENPKRIVYNRDSIMDSLDLIHLSVEGKTQLQNMGKKLNVLKFRIKQLWTSPETRAIESADALKEGYKNNFRILKKDELDEILFEGPYKDGLSIDPWERGEREFVPKKAGYRHEKTQSVVDRMDRAFAEIIYVLRVGETGILISHGDPIAYFINFKLNGIIPDYHDFNKVIYVKKGEALVIIIDADSTIFSQYTLPHFINETA